MENNKRLGWCLHQHPQSVEAAKSFTCQTFESAWIAVMDRQILGPGLRQRDPVSLPSCRRLLRPKLVRRRTRRRPLAPPR